MVLSPLGPYSTNRARITGKKAASVLFPVKQLTTGFVSRLELVLALGRCASSPRADRAQESLLKMGLGSPHPMLQLLASLLPSGRCCKADPGSMDGRPWWLWRRLLCPAFPAPRQAWHQLAPLHCLLFVLFLLPACGDLSRGGPQRGCRLWCRKASEAGRVANPSPLPGWESPSRG